MWPKHYQDTKPIFLKKKNEEAFSPCHKPLGLFWCSIMIDNTCKHSLPFSQLEPLNSFSHSHDHIGNPILAPLKVHLPCSGPPQRKSDSILASLQLISIKQEKLMLASTGKKPWVEKLFLRFHDDHWVMQEEHVSQVLDYVISLYYAILCT